MSCKFDKKLLYSLADDTIESLERIFAEEHLKYCSICKKEYEYIIKIDDELEGFKFEIPVPERLSAISQLVVENCINEIEQENEELRVHNYNEDMKLLRKAILNAYIVPYNNPYNNFIEKSLTKTINFIGKPVKNYYKGKISKSKIVKLFKAV